MLFRPHDLLRLSRDHLLPADAPGWAASALRATPWVVVRRAPTPLDRIAVGARGTSRSERYAMEVGTDDVCEVVTPEDLAHVDPLSGRVLPVMATLVTVRTILDDNRLSWGPTGSVGFELATGVPTATTESDLDLIVRIPRGAELPDIQSLHRRLLSLAVRTDCQVETPSGAVALAELVGGQTDIMLRTAEGPRLVPRALVMS